MPSRLYFSNGQAAPASPAFGGWDMNTGSRQKLLSAKEAGETLGSATSGGTAANGCFRQYVSDALSAQTISGTLKTYLRCFSDLELDVSPRILVRVCSGDGSTIRGTLLALGNYGGANFSISALQNRIFADGDALSGLAVLAGDRLVIEIGANNPSGGDAFIGVGAAVASDLPENETETGNLVPWIEFSGTIAFESAAAFGGRNLPLLGVG